MTTAWPPSRMRAQLQHPPLDIGARHIPPQQRAQHHAVRSLQDHRGVNSRKVTMKLRSQTARVVGSRIGRGHSTLCHCKRSHTLRIILEDSVVAPLSQWPQDYPAHDSASSRQASILLSRPLAPGSLGKFEEFNSVPGPDFVPFLRRDIGVDLVDERAGIGPLALDMWEVSGKHDVVYSNMLP